MKNFKQKIDFKVTILWNCPQWNNVSSPFVFQNQSSPVQERSTWSSRRNPEWNSESPSAVSNRRERMPSLICAAWCEKLGQRFVSSIAIIFSHISGAAQYVSQPEAFQLLMGDSEDEFYWLNSPLETPNIVMLTSSQHVVVNFSCMDAANYWLACCKHCSYL